MATCKLTYCIEYAGRNGGGYCMEHQTERAKAAEARAAQLEAEVEAHRAQQAQIRELVSAYSEHDTIEAVRRFAGRLHDAETERDEARRQLEKAQNIARNLQEAVYLRKGIGSLTTGEEISIHLLNQNIGHRGRPGEDVEP